jgi:hypothetical protein
MTEQIIKAIQGAPQERTVDMIKYISIRIYKRNTESSNPGDPKK